MRIKLHMAIHRSDNAGNHQTTPEVRVDDADLRIPDPAFGDAADGAERA